MINYHKVKAKPLLIRVQGNVLALVTLCIMIVLVILGLGLSVNYFFLSHQFIKNDADQLATELAINLNYNDRIGQMNNLVANSRELVFNSRANSQQANADYPHIAVLADRLLSDSRAGADAVEKARQNLITLIVQDLGTSVKTANVSGRLGKNANLPWARSNQAEILNLRIGNIKGVDSNVQAPYGNDDLLGLDSKSGYIDPATHLYYGRSILKLPDDPDKQFRLGSLAAPVKGSVAPPRLTGPQAFEKSADLLQNGEATGSLCDQLPTAVQITVGMYVTNQVAVKSTHMQTVDATAATSGAKPVVP